MLNFYKPEYDPKVLEILEEVLKSGWITTGPKTKDFEKKLSEYCGNKKTLCVSAATTGMELILRWFGVGEGDEVILPAYTYCATANVIIHCGAKPIFVDVGSDFNINTNAIYNAITENTKVIIPVDFSGYPCDYDLINDLVKKDEIISKFKPIGEKQKMLGRILVLSDAAHSIGGVYKGEKTGSLTDISVFSFHAVKNLTTGEGGAISLNLEQPFENDDVYKELNTDSLHGQTKDALAKNKLGDWRYDVTNAGYKCNMTDLQAALGLVALEKYEEVTLVKRKAIFDYYTELLRSYDWAELPDYESEHKTSSYHFYALKIYGINEQQRDQIIQEIANQEISVNVHFQPVPMLTFYKKMGYNVNNYPVALDNYSREITLPVYVDLKEDEIKSVVLSVVKSIALILNK